GRLHGARIRRPEEEPAPLQLGVPGTDIVERRAGQLHLQRRYGLLRTPWIRRVRRSFPAHTNHCRVCGRGCQETGGSRAPTRPPPMPPACGATGVGNRPSFARPLPAHAALARRPALSRSVDQDLKTRGETMKSFRALWTLIAAVALTTPALAQRLASRAEGDRDANNSIFIEAGGPGLLYSVNYERVVENDWAVRIGASYTSISASAGSSSA